MRDAMNQTLVFSCTLGRFLMHERMHQSDSDGCITVKSILTSVIEEIKQYSFGYVSSHEKQCLTK